MAVVEQAEAPAAADSERPPTKLRHRDDITGMRAVAVGLVVAFHAGVPWLAGGYVGVDVFFVISGFLITALLVDELAATGTISLRHFYARRMRRLLPLASLTLIVTLIAADLILSPLDMGGVVGDARAAALWFANWHFAAGAGQYMATTDQSPTLHYWSLSVEEQFYVVWPLLLLALCAGRSLPWPQIRRRAAIGLAVVFASSLAASALLTSSTGQYGYYGLHTRGWELALGGGLALARPVLPRLSAPLLGTAGLAGLAMVVSSAILFDRATVFPGVAALLPVVGSGLLLVAGARGAAYGVPRLLSLRPMVFVGDISYGWYLWHWPCLILGQAYYDHGAAGTDATGGGAVHPLAVALPAVVGSFVLAVITHRLVERPVRRSRWLSVVAARSLAAGSGLVVLVLVIGLVAQPSTPKLPGGTEAIAPSDLTAVTSYGTVSASSPAPLRMTPTAATLDYDKHDGCNVDIAPSAPVGTCQYGDPNGTRTVVLVGDSHAEHWRPALAYLSTHVHWKFYAFTKSACAFEAPHTYSTSLKRPYTECEKFAAATVSRINALPRVDILLVARSYGFWTMDAAGNVLSGSARTPAWAAQAKSQFSAVRPKVRRIVVLRDTPADKVRAPSCLALHLTSPASCSFDKAGSVRDNDVYLGDKLAVSGLPASFLSLVPHICPLSKCPVVDDLGVIIYRNADHVTTTFSRLQWRLFGALLTPMLTDRSLAP